MTTTQSGLVRLKKPGDQAGTPSQSVTEIRHRLSEAKGPKFWRSLDELADTPEFRELLHREFPRQAAVWGEGLDRRKFLSLAGASLGMAGLTACTKQPAEIIVPYVRQPEELVPGRPLYYATTMMAAGYGVGVLAESHTGRPTKIEGNPEHPASLGGTDIFTQASVLELYDPDRSQTLTDNGRLRSWGAFLDELSGTVAALKGLSGQGLRILTGTVTSPTLAWFIGQLLEEMPEARWHRFESADREAARSGAREAFGEPVAVRYDFTAADVVVAVDSDFLSAGPGAVRYAKDFSSRRRVADPADASSMSRLYAVETVPTSTSTVADHRLVLSPSDVARFVVALAAKLGVAGATPPIGFGEDEKTAVWIDELAADLLAHKGSSLVVAGDQTDAEIHVLVHAINDVLGNLGTTVITTEEVEVGLADGEEQSFDTLLADMNAGEVDTLIILGANPVYGAGADRDVAAALAKVRFSVHLGLYADETAAHCRWHIPEAHYLEGWGDARAFDGTTSIVQPLIEPLYSGKTAIEVVAAFLDRGVVPSNELVREHWQTWWQANGDGSEFEAFWRRSLHDGLVADSQAEVKSAALQPAAVAAASTSIGARQTQGLELLFRPDPSVFDGRYANNSWLQECPKPITKLTWDNALFMSPKTARDLGLGDLVKGNDQSKKAPMVRLTVGERSMDLAVWVIPGHADGSLTLSLGYGRTHAGRAGDGAGFDAGTVRATESTWRVSSGVSVEPISGQYDLASTQDHHSMEGRHMVRMTDLDHYLEDPEHAGAWEHHGPVDISLMKDWDYSGRHAWGMSIDLTSCTGCNACLVACQSENNITAVGKDQVMMGREMHWIRLDRYFAGEDADHVDTIVNQPVPCMQCEQAPCEVVCPVAATVHSDEGLNDMIYNRCVGTRYCSNNCPYKVRRFNFLLYQDFETPSLQLGRNPDVTVRSRGVMEKCTYCVQRINHARIEAKVEGRKIRDGEVVTACQQVCPSDAIVFGDINDADAQVTQRKASPLDFTLLEELGNRPRTTYLGRVRNLNRTLLAKLGHDVSKHDDHHGEEKHHG